VLQEAGLALENGNQALIMAFLHLGASNPENRRLYPRIQIPFVPNLGPYKPVSSAPNRVRPLLFIGLSTLNIIKVLKDSTFVCDAYFQDLLRKTEHRHS
jgi:hypothetical protein